MTQPLAGRNAILFGVERPLGRAAAVVLAEAGANVAVVTLSEDTKAEFAANSTANEFWAIGRRGIALTSDGGESGVKEAIASATAELGPVSIAVWHGPAPIARDALAGLRSDPAVVVLIGDGDGGEGFTALMAWLSELVSTGLRANAVLPADIAPASSALARHAPPVPMTAAQAVVYLASDATAALEGTYIAAEP